MRILHTSDWHLGKKTEGRDRLPEQRAVLDEIVALAESEAVDVVLVAGDVFDTFVPPADAEELFYDTVYRLSDGKRSVVVISGNHDDAQRLAAAAPFAAKRGVYIVGDLECRTEEIYARSAHGGTQCGCIAAGRGYVVLQTANGERLFVALLPYPTEARFKEFVDENESWNDKMRRWLNVGLAQNTEGLPAVLVGHFFTLGGEISSSERTIDLGGARAVDKDLLPDCAYIALGHLHKRQTASKSRNAFYSGAILEYAFDEAGVEKSVNIFDLNAGRAENFCQKPLLSGKKLVRLEAVGYAEALSVLEKNRGAYAELTLRLDQPLSDRETRALRHDFPDLLSLVLQFDSQDVIRGESKRSLTDEQLFEGYYRAKFGGAPSDELKTAFNELIAEAGKWE